MGSVDTNLDLWSNYCNTINGKLTTTKELRQAINPATGKSLPSVPVSTIDDVEAAICAAKGAFKIWSQTSWAQRSEAVAGFADAIEKHVSEFARLLTAEQGKPNQFSIAEVHVGVAWLRAFKDMELKEEIVSEGSEKQTILRYTPLGVVVGIVPWNYPIHLACGKIGPAVMTGNPIIIKPSPFTPYCDLKLGELAQQFFPPGVVQVLSGGDDLGPMLTAHPGPDKISFTGSTFTGKKVMESASKTLKRVTLELGGNDPAIVCADIDIRTVARKVTSLAFLNSGQICLALKRIYVHESIYPEFLEEAVAFAKTIKVAEGNEPDTFMGPVQNLMQYQRVKGFFDDVKTQNMKVAVGGTTSFDESGSTGYFIEPTIIDRPAEDSRLVLEEPFGPIVPFLTWKDEDDVIVRANDTRMGLGASVWSTDLVQARRIAMKLEAGNVWVNTHLELDPNVAFGGHKESGIGFEWGIGGLKSYCNVQSVFIKNKA